MLIKLGVDISRLKPPIRKKLNTIEKIFNDCADCEAVISSTYEGNHSPSSLHYADLAIDFRLPPRNVNIVVEELKRRLGKDYDILREVNHIHIEFDPK
jgi:hypothetical protein